MTQSSISPFCTLSENQIERLNQKIWVNGQLRHSESKKLFSVIHSARNKVVAKQAECPIQEVQEAVGYAKEAQKSWARMSSRDRGKILRKGIAQAEKAQVELAQLLTLETSKALRTESELDVKAALDILDFFSGLGSEIKGETLSFRPDVFAFTQREPIGVIGAIIPWNVPLMLMALKIGPALIAGNTVVLKTSEYAPLSALRFAELLGSELPPGVLNVISGHGNPTGQALVDDPRVGKITFTGSVATGRSIYERAASRLIPVTLELGGKSPMIICEDADLESVVQGAINGMRFTRQGQSCSASSRIYVHGSLFESFVEEVGKRLDLLKMGDPFDPSVQVGAIACQMQYDKIQKFIQSIDPKQLRQFNELPKADLSQGLFVRPTLALLPDENQPVAKEEVFGPLACVFQWSETSNVIQRANDTSFGLAATVWTKNIQTAFQFTQELEAGFVQVNQNLVVQAGLPYGGYKSSGLGKEASLESMLEHFTRSKTVLMSKL